MVVNEGGNPDEANITNGKDLGGCLQSFAMGDAKTSEIFVLSR